MTAGERFKDFTDLEIYILSRAFIESSGEIMMSGRYQEDEMQVYSELLTEIEKERKKRLCQQ